MGRRLIWVRRWYAADLPAQPIGWKSWAWWRWMQKHPDDPSVEYVDVEERDRTPQQSERPWGDGMTQWNEIEWPVNDDEREAA